VVDRYSRYVYAIATRAFRLSQADAEDVFQEVFSRVFTHLDRLRDDTALRPWIAQVTRRAAVDRLRGARRTVALGDREPEDGAADPALERIEEAVAVHAALSRLPEPCRDVLDRFFCRDQSYAMIAAETGLAHGTIASRIARCLARLREALEEPVAAVPARPPAA